MVWDNGLDKKSATYRLAVSNARVIRSVAGPGSGKTFALRYSVLTEKDFPVLLATGIVQSTLSSWRKHSRYPRADEAEKIAKALDTTVEYLVSGTDTRNSVCSSYGLDIAVIADKLNSEGFQILKSVAKGLIHDFGKNKESHD